MNTSDFSYELPAEYIAQTPVEPRDSSRLMVLDRKTGEIYHTIFRNIGDFLTPGDLLVVNETRVIPARLFARKIPGGGKVELLLLQSTSDLEWKVLVGGKGLITGVQLRVENGPIATITEVYEGPKRLVRFSEPIEPYFSSAGHVPLPPYIHQPLANGERYQTVYARLDGSAAAPTAGLHFTPQLIDHLSDLGFLFSKVLLHVGLDTFSPVTEEDPLSHVIHSEWCKVQNDTVEAVRGVKENGRAIVAVGTTSVRALESAGIRATSNEILLPYEGSTDLFILPGYEFRVVDKLITNFHLPRSTLLMLVSAFAGREVILNAYEEAKKSGYRFYSFGDAMLIL